MKNYIRKNLRNILAPNSINCYIEKSIDFKIDGNINTFYPVTIPVEVYNEFYIQISPIYCNEESNYYHFNDTILGKIKISVSGNGWGVTSEHLKIDYYIFNDNNPSRRFVANFTGLTSGAGSKFVIYLRGNVSYKINFKDNISGTLENNIKVFYEETNISSSDLEQYKFMVSPQTTIHEKFENQIGSVYEIN